MRKPRTSDHSTVSADVQQIEHINFPRPPAATGGPVLSIDLPASILELKREGTPSGSRNAMTLVKHKDFRVVLSVMKAGTKLARHTVRGTVLIEVLSGNVRIGILDATLDATAGQIISLDPNLPHEVQAAEDTTLLITIAWPGHSCPAAPEISARRIGAVDTWYDWRADEAVWN